MTYTKFGLPFLYDDATGDIVGVKDADGGETTFVRGVMQDGAMVGFAAGADEMRFLPEIASYAALRAYSGPLTAYYVRGVASLFDGGAGMFRVDAGDTTSADNGGTVLVDANGRRWKREFSGQVHIDWFGAAGDGVEDDLAAYNGAKAVAGSDGVVRFTTGKTYYFAGSRPNLAGTNIYAEPGVTIAVDENPNTKDLNLLTPITIQNAAHGTALAKSANTQIPVRELFNIAPGLYDLAIDEVTDIVDLTTWQHKAYVAATGDVTTNNGTATITSAQATWATAFTGSPQVFYPSVIAGGTMYEINGLTATTSNSFGVFVKVSDGVWQVRVTVNIATLTIRKVDNSGSVVITTDKTLPNGGAYGWLVGQEANVGFVVDSSDVTTVIVNGLPVYRINEAATHAGFIVSNGANSNQVTLKDLISTTNYRARMKKPMTIGVIGDSISYGAWCSNDIADLLPPFVQNLPQVGDVSVTNYAVSGADSAYWATGAGASVSLSGNSVVLCMLGTNDVQGGVSTTNYVTNLATIANRIVAAGAVPVFGIFPIFTTAAISGVTGVTTTNYANHAKYTHALKKFCVQNGYAFADVRRAFGANIAWYGDNIHPTVEGQIAIMAAWAEGIGKAFKHGAYF